MTKQSNALQQKVSLLHDIKAKKGKTAALFKLKEGVVGPKSAQTEAISLLDPESGREITSTVGIRKASLDYCTKLLTNRAPRDGYVEVTEQKLFLHLSRMKDLTVHESDILTEESFNYTYNRLAKKPGHKMDFIMKAGNSLKPALYQLCKRVWDEEKIPESWNTSTLVQLYKGSGPKNRLENQRFIHMKGEFSKFFGNLLMDSAKASIFENMSPFQIGTKPGHRAQEDLFVVKSAMALQNKLDKALIISFWDIQKYFDSESLIDVMNELHRNKVRGKVYRLLYLMNCNTNIQIQTPVGLTDVRNTGETLGQGTVMGAIASAVNLDNGVQDSFHLSEEEITYLGVPLGPLLFRTMSSA